VTVRGVVILLIMRYGQAKTQPTEPSQSNGALVVKYSNSAVMQQPNAKNAGEFGVAVTSHADQERRAQQHERHQELIRDPLFSELQTSGPASRAVSVSGMLEVVFSGGR
jgi:hypothetical protein